MRLRSLVAVALVVLPSTAIAQRLPRIGTRTPPRAALPPQAPVVTKALAYSRLRASFESYPMVTFFNTGSFTGNGQSQWATTGLGSRVDYRVARLLSATLDVTSSFLGGPVYAETAELGFRIGPHRSERSVYPFFDLRYGYFITINSTTGGDISGITVGSPNVINYSEGFGGVLGGGMEFTLTRTLSMTAGMSAAHSNMTAMLNRPTVGTHYPTTMYRYVVALRFNPVRYGSGNASNTPR